jgi:hypothetical protein
MSDDNTDDSLAGLKRSLVSSDFPSLHSLVQDSGDTTPFNSPKIMANLSRASDYKAPPEATQRGRADELLIGWLQSTARTRRLMTSSL